MITKQMIKDGYNKGFITLIESPNGDGIACQIGDNWFYFGGSLAESCETVEEYKSLVLITDIMKDIYEVLKDFQTEFEDEYLYYEYYLKEKGIKERMDVKELNRDELNELKSSYLTKLKEDESPSYQDYGNAENIPDEIIFEEYAGITFVKEDFFCNLKDDEIVESFYAKIDSERNKFQESYKTMEYIQIYNDYYIIGFYEAIHEILTSDYVKDNYLGILEWLNTKENPLEYLYDKWMDMDGSFDFGWDENISWINILYRKEKEV